MSESAHETLLFDLYGTLVDPIAISAELARHLSVEDAETVARTWRQKQIEYAFRLTMMERYETFEWITARALDYALLACGCTLDKLPRRAVLDKYDAPEPFPDVPQGLRALADSGHQLYVLSNGSPDMLQRCLVNSGLIDHFTAWLSVDAVGAFKPVARVYRHASTILGRPISELRLVSCNPFDVVGGKAAGMRTTWINRSGGPFDTTGEDPDMVCSSIAELASALPDIAR